MTDTKLDRPREGINPDNWRHTSSASSCVRLWPHYGADGKWRCDSCQQPVQVR